MEEGEVSGDREERSESSVGEWPGFVSQESHTATEAVCLRKQNGCIQEFGSKGRVTPAFDSVN
jgi:hypothetical protein